MAINAVSTGKMLVIIRVVTTGTLGENLLPRWVVLMTIDTTDSRFMPPAPPVDFIDRLFMATDAGGCRHIGAETDR